MPRTRTAERKVPKESISKSDHGPIAQRVSSGTSEFFFIWPSLKFVKGNENNFSHLSNDNVAQVIRVRANPEPDLVGELILQSTYKRLANIVAHWKNRQVNVKNLEDIDHLPIRKPEKSHTDVISQWFPQEQEKRNVSFRSETMDHNLWPEKNSPLSCTV